MSKIEKEISRVIKERNPNLSLSGAKFERMPNSIFGLSWLESLTLENCQISDISKYKPDSLKLRELSIKNCGLRVVPEWVFSIKTLVRLELSNNQIINIADEVKNLEQLKTLFLDGNKIENLPENVCCLIQLEHLELDRNPLAALPNNIGFLKNLERLSIDDANLCSFPDSFGELKKLLRLDADRNKIKVLPNKIGKLSQIKRISLDSNELTQLPNEISKLHDLERLSLDDNTLHGLPADIGDLKKLQVLRLSDNNLKTLPISIGNLERVLRIDLARNMLVNLPCSMGNLSAIQVLNISENSIINLPDEICSLPVLQEVYLNANELTALPDSIGQIQSLTEIYISNNSLSAIPSSLANLKNLKKFICDDNGLEDLNIDFTALIELETLSLNRNQFKEFPKQIFQASSLRNLSLQFNQIKSIPSEISWLTQLRKLDIRENRVNTLPVDIAYLDSLKELLIRGCPLKSLSKDFSNFSTEEIIKNLKTNITEREIRSEVKLVLLGQGGTGKTCVSRALRGLEFSRQNNTKGVDITKWWSNFTVDDTEYELTINIWDFEGQEINHQSHQFFLTENSVYIIVFNGRAGETSENLIHWLDIVKARAPKSPLLIVATECEDRTPLFPIDNETLVTKTSDFTPDDYITVGCINNKNISLLKNKIIEKASHITSVIREWPISFKKSEKEIESKIRSGNAYISRNELLQILDSAGIHSKQYETTCAKFNELGIITQFLDSPDLFDFIVLKPDWLTKAISCVLENDELAERQGELDHSWLHSLWLSNYPNLYSILYACMRDFELCYRLDAKSLSLVPLRFPTQKPNEIPWEREIERLERIVEYRFSSQIPIAVISRFIVKVHHLIVRTKKYPKGFYWAKGVFLRYAIGESSSDALVELNSSKDTIRLCVRSIRPQQLLEHLNGFLTAVFVHYPGISFTKFYGCVKIDSGKCDALHSEEDVAYHLHENEEILCSRGRHKIPPLFLVHGLHSFNANFDAHQLLGLSKKWAADFGNKFSEIEHRLDILSERFSPANIGDSAYRILQTHRELLNILDERNDNRTPGLFTIKPVKSDSFNPKFVFSNSYEMRFYCECETCPHPGEKRWTFTKPKSWWKKTQPVFKVSSQLLSLFNGITSKLLNIEMQELDFLKDVEVSSSLTKQILNITNINGKNDTNLALEINDAKYDFRNDENYLIGRIELANLMKEIDPIAYEAKQWGNLKRVRLSDNSYRWLCPEHRKVIE